MHDMTRDGRIQRLRPEAIHFFDTNFVVRSEADLPSLRNVPPQSRWITETVRQEVLERGGTTAQETLDTNFHTLSFDDLYADDPRVCPVFYWYVLSMYNPATVGSESFIDDQFESKLIKGTVTQADRGDYWKTRCRLGNQHASEVSRDASLQRLERVAARLRKKARRSLQDRHPAYIRDIKSLGLAIYYALSSRRNTVYYTADGDLVILLFKWFDSMLTQATLMHAVLARLSPLDKKLIMRGGTTDVVLDFAQFVREKSSLYIGLVSDRRKSNACRFSIKYWNWAERKLDEDVYLWFDDRTAGWLTNLHGPMSCGCTANTEFGNWLRLLYHWPPDAAHEGKLLVQVTRKTIVNRTSTSITPSEHDRLCTYRREDASGKIQEWSHFI
jgi:hypothetical protein